MCSSTTHHSEYFGKSVRISQTFSTGASITTEVSAVNGPVYDGGGRFVGWASPVDIVARKQPVSRISRPDQMHYAIRILNRGLWGELMELEELSGC